jgi:hypothetical protein
MGKFMCALVQAIRKTGIVAGGPGIGAAANPMHIVRTSGSESVPAPTSDRPSTDDGDTSFGQNRRIVEDPTTQVDDDKQPELVCRYYNEESLDWQLAGTTAIRLHEGEVRGNGGDMEQGKSFGRRRIQSPADLEKGPQHLNV